MNTQNAAGEAEAQEEHVIQAQGAPIVLSLWLASQHTADAQEWFGPI
jgi:hypothetical protein